MNNTSEDSLYSNNFPIDVKVFLFTVIVGFMLMSFSKMIGIHQLLVTAIMVFVIVAYSVVIYRVNRLHLRLDQAGDNAYYLGLIFTLLSMAWALWSIGQRLAQETDQTVSVAESVIGDFGLALGTTLAGIVCRIVLHQMRFDVADVEEQQRIRVADASNKLVAELNSLSLKFSNFMLTLQQRQDDYSNEMLEIHKLFREKLEINLTESTDASKNIIRESATEISRSMKEYIDVTTTNTEALVDATNRLRDVEISPIKISRSIDKIVAKMEELCNSVELTNSKLGSAVVDISSVTNHVEDAKSQLNSLASRIDDSSKMVSDEMIKVSTLTQSATEYLETIKASAEELGRNTGETTSIVEIIETKAVDTLDRLTAVIGKLDKTLDGKAQSKMNSE